MLHVTDQLAVPLREFDFTFVRSSGPGGQNVNKLNTKAQLRWNATTSPSLDEPVRQRFLEKYRRRITNDGEIIITSQRFRDQGRNVADCLEKLRTLLLEAAVKPKPRKPSKPSRAVKERRLQSKREQAEKKNRRRFRPEP